MATKPIPDHVKYGLSLEYWNRISPRDRALYGVIRPMPRATYKVDHHFGMLAHAMDGYKKSGSLNGGTFEINPDFQRGHVWDEAKQVAYIENLFRGIAPHVLKFNCAGWNALENNADGDLHPNSIVCVDGLQRLTAAQRFIAGEIKAFGKSYDDLEGTSFSPSMGLRVTVEMFEIKNRVDLLQFYLDLNSGGVVHSPQELNRVRELLADAKVKAPKAARPASLEVAPEELDVDTAKRPAARRRAR